MDSVDTQLKTKDTNGIESCNNHNRSQLIDQLVLRSCLKKWCCINLVLLLTLPIGLVSASYVWFPNHVHTWTTTSSPFHSMPIVPLLADNLEIFKNEAKVFVNNLHLGVSDTSPKPNPLEVTEQNLNRIAYQSNVVTNEVTIDICLPIDDFPGGTGRDFRLC